MKRERWIRMNVNEINKSRTQIFENKSNHLLGRQQDKTSTVYFTIILLISFFIWSCFNLSIIMLLVLNPGDIRRGKMMCENYCNDEEWIENEDNKNLMNNIWWPIWWRLYLMTNSRFTIFNTDVISNKLSLINFYLSFFSSHILTYYLSITPVSFAASNVFNTFIFSFYWEHE